MWIHKLAAMALGGGLALGLGVPAAGAKPPPGYRTVVSRAFASPHLVGLRGKVHCPGTTVPLGGGTFTSSLSTQASIGGTFPTARGWFTDFDNESSSDTIFDVRATCARRPPGYRVIRSEPVLVPSGAQGHAFAVCPSGTRTLGGGGEWDTSGTELNLNSSFPGPFTWDVIGNNTTLLGSHLTAFVVCGKPKGLTLVFGFTTNVGAGVTPLTISCPAGKVPLSGGLFANSPSVLVSLNATTFSLNDWITWVNNPGPDSVPAQPFVVCAGT